MLADLRAKQRKPGSEAPPTEGQSLALGGWLLGLGGNLGRISFQCDPKWPHGTTADKAIYPSQRLCPGFQVHDFARSLSLKRWGNRLLLPPEFARTDTLCYIKMALERQCGSDALAEEGG